MAHALYGHDGLCKNIHGHTYHLHVTLIGEPLSKRGDPKDGMIVDFKDFKEIVKEHVVDVFDHALVLNKKSPHAGLSTLQAAFEKLIYVPFQPSCENLIIEFKNRLLNAFENHNFILKSIKLYETPTSYSEWFLDDNL